MAVLKFDKKIYTGKWKQRINGYIGNSNIPYRDIFAQWIGNGKCVDFSNFNISTFSYPNSQSRRVVKMGFLGTAWALLKIVNFFINSQKISEKSLNLKIFLPPKFQHLEKYLPLEFSHGDIYYIGMHELLQKKESAYIWNMNDLVYWLTENFKEFHWVISSSMNNKHCIYALLPTLNYQKKVPILLFFLANFAPPIL